MVVVCCLACCPHLSVAGDLTLQWDAPSDGMTTGYVLLYGQSPQSYSTQMNIGYTTSYTVNGLSDGTTYYFAVRAYDATGGLSALSNEASATVTSAKAQMTAPAPSSTLNASTVQFQWTGGTGVTDTWLSVGTSAGVGDIFTGDQGLGLAKTISGLPSDGSALHVRLYSYLSGTWQYNDYSYTAFTAPPARAQMTTPAPSSTLGASTVQFGWTGGTAVTQTWLSVGTSVGAGDIFSGSQGLALSRSVSGIPANGSTVYVRLYSYINGGWQFYDYTYQTVTVPVPAQLTSPSPSSTLSASNVNFQWTSGVGVADYWLSIGTAPFAQGGGSHLYDADQGVALSRSVTGLPADGRALYVRLYSNINSAWQFADYTYTAVGSASSVTSSPATLTAPAPSSTLGASTALFQWTGGTGATDYWLSIGTAPFAQGGGSHLYDADQGLSLSHTVSNLPANGSTIYVRLYSYIAGAWQFHDYTYQAVSVQTVTVVTQAALTTPLPSSTLRASAIQFQWTVGTGATDYWLAIGTAPFSQGGGSILYDADQGLSLSRTVSNLPANGSTIYVRLYSYINGGWLFTDYVYSTS